MSIVTTIKATGRLNLARVAPIPDPAADTVPARHSATGEPR
jgi:hypothetical protein